MTASEIQQLAALAADVVELDGSPASRVELGELADGSRRAFALVTTCDATNDLEQTYRVALAAPWNAPEWASRFTDSTIEIRRGDSWLDLPVAS